MRLLSVAVTAACVLAAGCDSIIGSTPAETRVAFDYRLDYGEWQRYALSGGQPPDADRDTRGQWVHTSTSAMNENAFILAQKRMEDGTWADFWLSVPVLERGDTIKLQLSDQPCFGARDCVYANLVLNAATSNGAEPVICSIVTGVMVLRRVTPLAVSTTFSGVGTCFEDGRTRPFEVRDGVLHAVLPPDHMR